MNSTIAVELRPKSIVVVGYRSWSALHDIPARLLEKITVLVVMFVLSTGIPMNWFNPEGNLGAAAGNWRAVVLISGLAMALGTLGFELGFLLDAVRAEPMLPILMVWVVASTLWSTEPARTIDVGMAMMTILLIGYWMALRFSLPNIIGFASIALGLGLLVHLAFIVVLPQYGVAVDGNWQGVTGNKNSLGVNLALSMVVLVTAARTWRRYRTVLWSFVGLNIVLVIGSQSKTGLLAVLSVLGYSALFAMLRARRTLYGAIALSLLTGFIVTLAVAVENVGTVAAALGKDPRLTGRVAIWETLLDSIRHRPLAGYGWGGYFTDWEGPAGPAWRLVGFQFAHAHNGLLQMCLNLGLVGGVLLIGLYLRLVVRGARVVRYYQGAAGLFPLVYAGMMLVVSTTEAGVFDVNAAFLFLVIAVVAASRGRRNVIAPLSSSFSSSSPSSQG